MCESGEEAWDILEVTHEGTKSVKNSKLQMLTTSFEELMMKNDESFYEFYVKLNDIFNSSFNLGDKIPKNTIVRNFLRSLPERFRPKVIEIEENKDLDNMRIVELVGSLQTCEYTFSQAKKKSLFALKTVREESNESSGNYTMSDNKEIAFYTRKFKNLFVSKKGKNQGKNKKTFEIFKGNSS